MKEKTKSAYTGIDLLKSFKDMTRGKSKFIAVSLLYGFGAYLFGGAELVFETHPLGLALICAVTENVPIAVIGALAAAFSLGERAVIYVSGIIVACGFRYALAYFFNKKCISVFRLRDRVTARISSAAAGGFTVSLIRIIYGGFRYYDLLAGAFFVLCSAGAVYAYSACFDRENEYTQKYEAGVASVMFSVVLACRHFSAFGISVSSVAAFVITLFTARKGGSLRGALTGFICGAAIDLSIAPVFGITGFVCGLFTSFAAYIGALFSLAVGLFCSMYIGGLETLTGYLPEAALSAAIFLPLNYVGSLRGVKLFDHGADRSSAIDAHALAVSDELEGTRLLLRRLSDAAGTLSELTADLSAAERAPDATELSQLCRGCFEEFCGACVSREKCLRERGAVKRSEYERMGAAAYEKRSFSGSDIPARIAKICTDPEALALKINVASARLAWDRSKNDRAGVVSADAAVFSKLLKHAYKRSREQFGENEEATEKLLKSAPCGSIFGGNIAVCGERKKYITASGGDVIKIKHSAAEIKRGFEAALSEKLTDPVVTVENGSAVIRLETLTRFACEAAKAERVKENEIINGDTAFYFRGREERFFGVICDGMGSGRDAALSSKLSGVILDKLLSAGCDRQDSLETLNHIIRQKRSECFSTVDLLEVDLLNGKAVFYKCGAAPSLILRNGRVFRIASCTPPVGIMTEFFAEKIDFELSNNDVVVMMSDGITDAFESADRLTALLSDIEDLTPDNVAETVLNAAYGICGAKDDMTVLAVRIRFA